MGESKKPALALQIVLALIAGVVLGLVFYAFGLADFTEAYLKPFGTIFVNLLKFLVAPVVLLSMLEGIISMGDMRKIGSVGWKTVAYFMATTAAACAVGLTVAQLFNRARLFPVLYVAEGTEWAGKTAQPFMDTLVSVFPDNMFRAFANADMLQVIVISLLLGSGILAAGREADAVKDLLHSGSAVFGRVMAFIISLSPIGVFCMMSWVVATQGPDILGSLASVLLCAYLSYFLHAALVYSLSAGCFAGISPLTFFKKAGPALIFAFTSTSSAATLPVSGECAAELGADDDISSFVLPLGATINMDGTAIYQCVATVFLASCAGIRLSLTHMIIIVVTATLASIGTAGTPGAGMVMLAMVLNAMGIDVNMIMVIYGIDRLFDMGRTCLNVAGDISCACCVTRWENGRLTPKER